MSRVWGNRRLDNSFQGVRKCSRLTAGEQQAVMALTPTWTVSPPSGTIGRPFKGHVDEMYRRPRVDDDCLNSCQVTAVGAVRRRTWADSLGCLCGRHEDGSPEGTTEFTAANGD